MTRLFFIPLHPDPHSESGSTSLLQWLHGKQLQHIISFYTICPGSSDPPEIFSNIFALEN